MKHYTLLLALLLICRYCQAQQDVQLSQYIFNGIYINPAYSGYKGDIFLQSYLRSQWVGIKGAPNSFALAADGSFNDGKVGLGITLSADYIGAQSNTAGYLNYAYRIRTGANENAHLSFGLAVGAMQLGLNGAKLSPLQTDDASVPIASQSLLSPDANLGIYYASDRFFAGLSATNILGRLVQNHSRNSNLVPIPQPHFYLSGGTLLTLTDAIKFKPVLLIKDDMKGPSSMDLDGFVILGERISLGAFYRSSIKLYRKSNLQDNLSGLNAFGFIADIFATSALRIGYSYDHSLTSLASYNYGSHELSIGLYIDRNKNNAGGMLRCYQF